jgi:hypothetical protein
MISKLAKGVNLDTNGVVVISDGEHFRGWMHPYAFRDIMGEEAYQELLARPRVQSEYTEEELNAEEPDWDAIQKAELAGEQHDNTPCNPGADID